MHKLTESELRKIERRAERDSATVALTKQTEHAESMIVAAFNDRNKLLDHIDWLTRVRATTK